MADAFNSLYGAGRCKIINNGIDVAPESLTKEENVEFLKNVKISFYAVDEAHCIQSGGTIFVQNIDGFVLSLMK